ncbi:hypothetical protein [Metapseudomonas otitidis]|uniref:hypothetical protein n=1 Tax=Metapseudomonas otitidis TaxID=319939 RepID=UPI0013F5E96C|nr:hypothetical protein [Pseudomonas otitidis]
MNTYFTNQEFSSCEIGGLVAEFLIQDLRINNFTFTNLPEVIVNWDAENFYISLQAHSQTTQPQKFSHSQIKSLVEDFRAQKSQNRIFLNRIQDLAIELESLSSRTRKK